jgi:prevent-host-death family protein
MTTVGTFEAKTHLSALLERVARGERIVITSRGKPVAMLVPPERTEEKDAARVGREMLAYRDRVKRSLGSSFRETAHEGHRY